MGFGGPIALAGSMQRDLVERRRWVTREDYLDGLALAQLTPGPLAAQLAIYLGWVLARLRGATVVALAFIAPSFLMVLGLAVLYLRYGGMPWVTSAFYGVAPAVIAIVARGAVKLARLTLGRDALRWGIFAANLAGTAWSGREWMLGIVAGGALGFLAGARHPRGAASWLEASAWAWLVTGAHGPASGATLGRIASYFIQAGALVFGSGLAILPFLKTGVVDGMHWLDARQFMDAVAVGMITPGPVVVTVAFIGYLVGGPVGATLAALAVFVPCYGVVVVAAPHFQRLIASARLRHFVSGVTAAAAGAIAGAVVVLGRRALVDLPTTALAIGALLALARWPRLPEPALILLAGLAGLGLRRAAG